MKFPLLILAFAAAEIFAGGLRAEDWIDRLDEALTVSTLEDRVRARLSGTLDLEGYAYTQPAPGLIDAGGNGLFNPRLTLFLDAQLGPKAYLFAQARVDRGFDPANHELQARMDEYALRITPWEDGRASLQIGKFATVVGNWVERHLSWDNPFVTAPLPYENVTAASDLDAPLSAGDFGPPAAAQKYDHLPVIWGPSYASGASLAGRLGKFTYAAEIKNAALSSRPESWDLTSVGFQHPTVSGRIGYRPNQMWNFGFSASDGAYLRPEVRDELPRGRGISDYHQTTLGQDVAFAWHHLQVWAEFYESRFEVPRIGSVETFAYYLEAKYKLTPQLFGAIRWNQQLFSSANGADDQRGSLGDDLWRVDLAAGYRFSAHTQLKLQYSIQRQTSGSREYGQLAAAQFTLRF